MIPDFTDKYTADGFKILPQGIWETTLKEIEQKLLFNPRRIELFNGLKQALNDLKEVGCKEVFIDGSFVTSKLEPKDIDVGYSPYNGFSWDKLNELHPVFLEKREKHKLKYKCEFFDAYAEADNYKTIYIDYFQKTKGIKHIKKGILKIIL